MTLNSFFSYRITKLQDDIRMYKSAAMFFTNTQRKPCTVGGNEPIQRERIQRDHKSSVSSGILRLHYPCVTLHTPIEIHTQKERETRIFIILV